MKNQLHTTFLAILLFFITDTISAQQPEIYSKIKVYVTEVQLQNLVQQGLSMDEVSEITPYYIVGEFSPFVQRLVHESKLKTEVLVIDNTSDFQHRTKLTGAGSLENNDDCGPLPAGWTSGDVGAVGIAGSVCHLSPLYTIKGSGTGIEGSADQYQLVKTPISGDYTIIAKVNSITGTSIGTKAGIVITETTAAESKRVSIALIPSTGAIEFQSRSKLNGNVITTTEVGTAPKWLKLTRNKNTFYGYYSSDGVNWTLLKQANITLTTSAYAGLAVTSGDNTALSTAVFENVSVNSDIELLAATGVDPKRAGTLEAELNLYPNPSYRYINVTLPVQGKNADAEVQDLNGRVMKRYTNLSSVFQRFDITYLKAGVYILKVVQDNNVYSKQFVISQ